jgi:outer membrane protein TolC
MTRASLVAGALAALALQPAAAQGRKLTLEQAYAQAARSSPTMQVLRERVRQAEAAHRKAWSLLKPTASFSASFTHSDQEDIVFAVPGRDPMTFQKQDQFAWNAVANLPIFRGPAYPRLKMARQGVELARLREVRTQQDFLLRVAQAYYMVVTRADTLSALEHKLEIGRKHLAAARAQLEVGQAPRATVLRADLVVTQDEQSVRVARIALGAARRQLGILIGEPGSVDVERPAEPPRPGGSERGMTETALGRADVRAADLSIQLARKGKEATWWGFLPSLDLSWLYRWTEAAGFSGERGSWNLVFTLNVPIYDGGARYADLRDGHSKITEAVEQRRALGLEIEGEIVRLRAEVESASAGVVSAHKAVSLARTTEEDMNASYSVGAATQLDVLDASQRLLDAQLQLSGQLFQRDLARLALAHAQGLFDPLRRNK